MLIKDMSKEELVHMLAFVKNAGVCYESEVWSAFVQGDSIEDRARVVQGLNLLHSKGLIEQRYNEHAELIVIDQDIIYNS